MSESRVGLLPAQLELMQAPEPLLCYFGGRGTGKSRFGADWITTRAWQFPLALHLATANTYDQLNGVVVAEIGRALKRLAIPYRYFKAERTFVLSNGGKIMCRSLENYDALRGLELGSWWGDEVRDAPIEALTEVLPGCLRSKHVDVPKRLWTTTPRGKDLVWEIHVERPLLGVHRAVFSRTKDNAFLPRDFEAIVRSQCDEKTAQQELECKFINLAGAQAYYPFDRAVHVRECEYNQAAPLYLDWDFNIGHLLLLLGHAYPDRLEWCDEIELRDASVYDACDAFLARYGKHEGDVVYGGDPAGKQRTAQTGKSYYALIHEKLYPVFGSRLKEQVGATNPPQVDGVNAVNYMLRNANGIVRLFIDPKCKSLARDFDRVLWNEKGELDKSDHSLTHASDAIKARVYLNHRPDSWVPQPEWGMRERPRTRSLRERYASTG